ncbi:hypothetical protein UFOVP244_101 [uncultured Caudovirales phage]|uniref:Uncharacterized protein n=1 Tax=uncultured Caudovirales phage TaxID=2100421 RepID=A0A6J7WTA0_9CAUD|nr:hypothetical protein UFOVP244_101 [uncultured Caudovirales phage]
MILALVILLMANQSVIVAQPIIINTLVVGSLTTSYWDTATAYQLKREAEAECSRPEIFPALIPKS